jgi:hypothetical protein
MKPSQKQAIFHTDSWLDKTIGGTLPPLIITLLIADSEVSITGILFNGIPKII